MIKLSATVSVNGDRAPGDPELNRDQVWAGLLQKAQNALPFVPAMKKCETFDQGENWLRRDIEVFGNEKARERVTFIPKKTVRFDREEGSDIMGTIVNDILEDEQGNLSLRFSFELHLPGASAAEEEAYKQRMADAYAGAVKATLGAIRRAVKEKLLAA